MLDGGLTVEQIALIATLAVILNTVMEVPSGAISYMLGHKRTLILAMIGQGAAMLLFVGGTFWWFLAASLAYWGMGTLMTGTHQALFYERLIELKDTKNYRKYMGWSRSLSSAFSLVMVALAGVMYAWSPMVAFIFAAALFWLGGIVVLTMKQAKQKQSVQKREGFLEVITHFNVAMKTLVKDRRLFWMTVASAAAFGVLISVLELQQIVFEHIGIAAALFGFIYAAKRAVSMVLGVTIQKFTKHMTAVQALSIIFLLALTYLLVFGLVEWRVAIIFAALLAPVALVIQDLVVGDYMNKFIPTGSRATTISLKNLLVSLVRIVILGGITLTGAFISLEMAHVFIAILMVASAVYILPMTAKAFRA